MFLFLLCFSYSLLPAQTVYRTKVSNPLIRSLQVRVAGQEISEPFIELSGNEQIEINFDATTHDLQRYAYKIIHCNADWTPSPLLPVEYLNGFQGLNVDDYAQSRATITHYTNYRVLLPNDEIQFKVSGNYAVQFFQEDHPDEIILTACFSVVEPLVSLAGSISSNTDVDFNREHQQLSFSIYAKDFSIPYPQSDLKIRVYQNNRRDRIVTSIQPTRIAGNQLTYEHIRELIFEAGNEFRRIEFLTNRYNGMNIDKITYHAPYYHVDVMTDELRSGKSYVYDQDQDGRYFIRCSNCSDPDTEADYYIVHFRLAANPLQNGDIYISGDLFNQTLDENSRMEYNASGGYYEKAVLLKGGNYNYQYLYVPKGEQAGQTGPIEGNYYQTENEYTIAVYYSPMGARYDRLIGRTTLRNPQRYIK